MMEDFLLEHTNDCCFLSIKFIQSGVYVTSGKPLDWIINKADTTLVTLTERR